MFKYYIETYGCQMNYSDTERMETYLNALGFDKKNKASDADMVIFNTCSIRQKAEDRIFGRMIEMEKIKRKNKDLIVALTGCMIRKSSSRYSTDRDKLFNKIKELDICIRIDELPLLAGLIRELQPDTEIPEIKEESLEDYFKINATHSTTTKGQAFVAVSTGCDKFCTYCIVPYSRGREHSRRLEDILKEALELVEKGYKEITLIGQTVNSYGLSTHDRMSDKFDEVPEGKEPFVYLLEKLDEFSDKGLKRVRFTSSHPKDMSDQLIHAMRDLGTLMPYLHLPIQSGDSRTLKRMNRPYSVEKYLEIIEKLKNEIPDIAISTDIIVGFCGESDEEFENTYKLYETVDFDHAYIAQYSERKGTFAFKNIEDDIEQKVKKERWVKLNKLLKKTSTKKLKKYLGKTLNVLVESRKGDKCIGRSEHYKTVQFNTPSDLLGEIVPVKITNSKEWILEGEIVV